MRIGIVTHHATQTNLGLAAAAPRGIRSFVIPPEKSVQLEPCDAALGRLDVRPTLDGIEPGLARLSLLEARGLPVLNPPVALRLAHDKLATAPALAAAALPHPRTTGSSMTPVRCRRCASRSWSSLATEAGVVT
jgi:glutathione synthase/RimK-type ligase-like ATP-grasp enzyme